MLAPPAVSDADEIERAREVVRLTQQVLDGREIFPSFGDDDLHAAGEALSAARRALLEHLECSLLSPRERCHGEVAALLLRSELAQVSVKDAILARHNDMLLGAQDALGRLRGVASAASLAERAPVAASRMGFSRILFSRIRNGTWFACSACAGEDDEIAQTMVQVGLANPRRLNGPLLESEMVRRGDPILVRDPQSNPRVHPELAAVTNSGPTSRHPCSPGAGRSGCCTPIAAPNDPACTKSTVTCSGCSRKALVSRSSGT